MRNNQNQVVYVPENLPLLKLIVEFPPKFPYDIEFMYYLISILYTNIETEEQSSLYGYTTLYSPTLQIKENDYKRYLNYFQSNGVEIITDVKKHKLGQSRAYQLNPEYSQSDSEAVYLENPKFFKFHKFKKKTTELDYEKSPSYPFLESSFNDKLQIDIEAVKIEAVNIAHSNRDKGQFRFNYILQLENKAKNLHSNSFSTCMSFNRFYSPLTHLNKAFRKLLSYDGHILGGYDVKNSVPYILNIVLKSIDIVHHNQLHHYYSFRIRKGYIYDKSDNIDCYFREYIEVYNIIYSTLYNALTNTTLKGSTKLNNQQDRKLISIMLSECAETIVNKDFKAFFNSANKGRLTKHQLIIARLETSLRKISDAEREKYLELTSNGRIYEHIVETVEENCEAGYLFNLELPTTVGKSKEKINVKASKLYKEVLQNDTVKFKREVAKKIMWLLLAGTRANSPHEKAFFKSFSGISKFISDLKFIGNYRSRKGDDSKTFLQRIIVRVESHIMLNKVAKEFLNENPEAPVYTIHDGIYTIEPKIRTLEKKLKEVFGRYLKKTPQFHLELWCKECKQEDLGYAA